MNPPDIPIPDPSRFPRRWEDLTAPEIAGIAARDPVVVLPLAALEQHGPHLPVSTDAVIADGILASTWARLPADLPVLALPTQIVGTSAEHAAFAGTVSLAPDTLERALLDVIRGLSGHGMRRLVIFNTHGGNKQVVDQVALRGRTGHGMLVVKAHSFRFPRPDGISLPEEEWRHGLHGGAVETAMLLHLSPEAVRVDRVGRFPSVAETLETELDVLRPEGPASFAWIAQDLNADGVTGDARLATREIGRILVDGYGLFLARIVRDAARFSLTRLSEPG